MFMEIIVLSRQLMDSIRRADDCVICLSLELFGETHALNTSSFQIYPFLTPAVASLYSV